MFDFTFGCIVNHKALTSILIGLCVSLVNLRSESGEGYHLSLLEELNELFVFCDLVSSLATHDIDHSEAIL